MKAVSIIKTTATYLIGVPLACLLWWAGYLVLPMALFLLLLFVS